MSDLDIVFLSLSVHQLLCGLLLLYVRKLKHHFNYAHFSWILLIPVFGPVAGFSLARSLDKKPPDADWLAEQEERHFIRFHAGSNAESTVPLEEALFINDPHKRRDLMMNVLRSDPMRYLDLLLIARGNDDSETSHYATATVMEIQRQFQLELQMMQLKLANEKVKLDVHQQYIELLSRYCDSGLLEGQLLYRQRLVLKNALERALRMEENAELLQIKVVNSLALKDGQEAKQTAIRLIRLFPEDEKSWLEGLRVYTEIRDRDGMHALLERIAEEKIVFSAAGREHLNFLKGVRV